MINVTQVVDELLPSLHAATRAELVFWTETDLLQWVDEAAKRLSRVAYCFIERDTATTTVLGQTRYPLPARHVTTLHVSYGMTPIRPSGILELEMRDSVFGMTQGTPDHWFEDLQAGAQIGLSPVPNVISSIPIIFAAYPPEINIGNQQLSAPVPLKGYLAMSVLEQAYKREGEMEEADVAAHCMARRQMYEQILSNYYGGMESGVPPK